VSLDGVYDCRLNRKAIFNRGMVPNINANPRGRKPQFDAVIFKERFRTIERVFGWEDKFRHLLLRFERLSRHRQVSRERAWWSWVGQVNGRDDDASRSDLCRPSLPR
jgi:hypothetical protein